LFHTKPVSSRRLPPITDIFLVIKQEKTQPLKASGSESGNREEITRLTVT